MKICKTCKQEKNESEFFKKKERWLCGSCKQCLKEKNRKNFDKNLEENKEKERKRSEERRKTKEFKDYQRKYYELTKEKNRIKRHEYYLKNKKKLIDNSRKWKENNKKKFNECIKKSIEKYPLKQLARQYVHNAIRKGVLKRSLKCKKCLAICKTEAHHKDYTQPLKVVWLCRSCHAFEHRKFKYVNSCAR